jgi:hypothetical protein
MFRNLKSLHKFSLALLKDDFPTYNESHLENQKFILTSPKYNLKGTRVKSRE